jgi:hypothetical protein
VTVFLTLMLADIRSVVREGILVFIVAAMLITLIVVRLMGVYQLEWGTGPFLAFALIALLLFFCGRDRHGRRPHFGGRGRNGRSRRA